MVTGGAIGTGMFAIIAHQLFVTGKGAFQYRGEESLAGKPAIKYDFQLTEKESGLEITANNSMAVVGSKGSFWFDPTTLDLIRLDEYGVSIPQRLGLEETVVQTVYARTPISGANALLPKHSDLTMTHFSGEANRAAIEFSQCHEYRTESTISFDAPAAEIPQAPKPAVREIDLPPGLTVPIDFETAIDSKTSSVGDTLHGRVAEDVQLNGAVRIPRGAQATGHLRKLDRRTSASAAAVGVDLTEIEWEGFHAAVYGELLDLDRKSAGSHKPSTYYDGHSTKTLIEAGIPGAGIFFIDAASFHIPPGLHMVWRTKARPPGDPLR